MKLDSAVALECSGFAVDATACIAIATRVVHADAHVVDHDVALKVVTTAVAINGLEEHYLTHGAVNRLNVDEVFND